MWKLVIVDDQSQKTVVNLVRDQYTVGRDPKHSVRLTERNISRSHALLTRTDNRFRIEDVSSYNGIYVNGVRLIGRQTLAHGDLLQLGDYRVHVVDEAIDTQEQGYRPYSGENLSPASGRLPHRLVELIGPHQGAEYPLEGERFLIGRGPECEFVIDHGSVSRVHAEVRRIGDERFEIIDKGSANGLRVNGHALDCAILDGRDVLEVGDVVLKYIAQGQVFRASPAEGTRIAALAGDLPPPGGRTPRSGLVPSMLAAAVGAVIVRAIALSFLGGDTDTQSEGPLELSEATVMFERGDLLAAGREMDKLGVAEKSLAAYRDLEKRWAEAALTSDLGDAQPEQYRELLDLVAKRESLGPALREAAQKKLSSLSSAAVDLTALDAGSAEDAEANALQTEE